MKTIVKEIILRNWQNKKILIISKDFKIFKIVDDVEFININKQNEKEFYYYFYYNDFTIFESKLYSIHRFYKNKDKLYIIKD